MPWTFELCREFGEGSLLSNLSDKLVGLGLASAEQVVEFFEGGDVDEMVQELYPDAVVGPELVEGLRHGLRRLGATARLDKKRRYSGTDPRLSDAMYCVKMEKSESARKKEVPIEAVPGLSLDYLRAKRTWSTFGGDRNLADKDTREYDKWAARALGLLELGGVPSWLDASTSEDPAAVRRGLLGKARPIDLAATRSGMGSLGAVAAVAEGLELAVVPGRHY